MHDGVPTHEASSSIESNVPQQWRWLLRSSCETLSLNTHQANKNKGRDSNNFANYYCLPLNVDDDNVPVGGGRRQGYLLPSFD